MTEKELIEKLNKLSEIKPRKEWVVLAKNQILGLAEEKENTNYGKSKFAGIMDFIPSFIFQKQFAYAFSGILIVAFGVFGFIYQNMSSQIIDQNQVSSVSSAYDFNLVNQKLQQLATVIKDGGPGGIAPALDEFKSSVSDATQMLKKDVAQKNPSSLKDVALNLKQIEEKKNQLVLSGLLIDASTENDLNGAELILAKTMIDDLAKTTLTEEQQNILKEASALFEKENYIAALEKILLINN